MKVYTVMRQAVDSGTWEVWTAEANNEVEACEVSADIPGVYSVFEGVGAEYELNPIIKLKVQNTI